VSLFDDITRLESDIQSVINGAYDDPSITAFQQMYVDQIIEALADADLSTADLTNIVNQSLLDAADFIDEDLRDNINSNIEQVVSETTDFYEQLEGVALPSFGEAVARRKDAQALQEVFIENMGSMREELLDATIERAKIQIASGTLNISNLREELMDAAGGRLHWARTNARMVVGGYNRMHRDEVRKNQGYDRGYYYGDARTNTRPFCRALIGKVLNMTQIEELSNGQGLDVKVFCGGWNCIHSWLWLREGIDAQLDQQYTAERSFVDMQEDGLEIKVPQE
jgi:hypothetical protein